MLVLAGALRCYHLAYPVIGYHNWKETHYLTEARNFAREGFFAHGFFVPASDLPFLTADWSGAHADSFPSISILVAILFKLFGSHLGLARLLNGLLGVASVWLLFEVTRRLWRRSEAAYLAGFLAAVNPLLVYFSHNVQLESISLMFMLVGLLMYLRWLGSVRTRDAVGAATLLSLCFLTRPTFLIILVPMAVVFPWRLLARIPDARRAGLLVLGIFSSVPLWFAYMHWRVAPRFGAGEISGGAGAVNMTAAFTRDTWLALASHGADNYGAIGGRAAIPLGILLALVGLVLLIRSLRLPEARGSLEVRFLGAYCAGAVPWFLIMSDKLRGHSYHQYAVAPLVLWLITHAILVIAAWVQRSTIRRHVHGVMVLALAGLMTVASGISAARLFDTQFVGLDVAGRFIRDHSVPGETIFHSTHQSYGVLWHADRKGFRPPSSAEEFRYGEDARNVRWVFAYSWGLQEYLSNPGVRDHLLGGYALRQVGFQTETKSRTPLYFLFQKGGSTDLRKVEQRLRERSPMYEEYRNSGGPVRMAYVNFE